MVTIDLITGFLGSGKTTFLKNYVQYLNRQGQNVCILENDFGAINVDAILLQDILGDLCDLEMVVGGDGKEAHMRRFRTKLISMAMLGYDRVVVEPSGIFDPDEFFDALQEEPLDRWYKIGNVIAVVDAGIGEELSDKAGYMLATEAADAGMIVLSKSQLFSTETADKTIEYLQAFLHKNGCKRNIVDSVVRKEWSQWTEEDYAKAVSCGHVRSDYVKNVDMETAFDTQFYFHLHMSEEQIREACEKVFADPECGHVFRIKGFFPVADAEIELAKLNEVKTKKDESWLEVNATRQGVQFNCLPDAQEVLILIGEDLNKEKLDTYFEKYITQEYR